MSMTPTLHRSGGTMDVDETACGLLVGNTIMDGDDVTMEPIDVFAKEGPERCPECCEALEVEPPA